MNAVHSFNVKPIKMLRDPVAEAFGLIHRHPSGENFWHGNECSNEIAQLSKTKRAR